METNRNPPNDVHHTSATSRPTKPAFLLKASFGLILTCLGCDAREWLSIDPKSTDQSNVSKFSNSMDVPQGKLVASHTPPASSSMEVGSRWQGTASLESRPPDHETRQLPYPGSARFETEFKRPPLLAIEMADCREFGLPIGLFEDRTLLMRRDGSIQYLDNSKILRQRVLPETFESIERNELAKQLYDEFGRRYAVKFEAPYVVIADGENIGKWAHRFRTLFHSYRLYCKTHGLALREIEFPLVAIVLESQREFLHYAFSEGANLPKQCVGYYSQKSNRIVLYESSNQDASDTLDTICHEAVHQLAFNAGQHQRMAATPLWLAEGFATMFEAPKWSGLQSRDSGSLWPESRRHDWAKLKQRPEEIAKAIDSLIRNDSYFERESLNAYCISWAMTAYLSQRRSKAFNQYLQQIADRPPFEPYTAGQRVADFRSAFGIESKMLAKSVISFIESTN